MLALPAFGSYLEFKTDFENQFCERVYLLQHFEWQKEDNNCKLKVNPLNAKLNPVCHLLPLLEAHHILHVSKVRVNSHYRLP